MDPYENYSIKPEEGGPAIPPTNADFNGELYFNLGSLDVLVGEDVGSGGHVTDQGDVSYRAPFDGGAADRVGFDAAPAGTGVVVGAPGSAAVEATLPTARGDVRPATSSVPAGNGLCIDTAMVTAALTNKITSPATAQRP